MGLQNFRYLINKYGIEVLKNGETTKLRLDKQKDSLYRKNLNHVNSLEFIKGFCVSPTERMDKFLINEEEYLVYESENHRIKDIVVYSAVRLFKNDFEDDIEVYKNDLSKSVNNYPEIQNYYLVTKARFITLEEREKLELPIYNSQSLTHVFYTLFSEDFDINKVDITHRIKCKNRWFVVQAKENFKEKDVLMLFYCIESLAPKEL